MDFKVFEFLIVVAVVVIPQQKQSETCGGLNGTRGGGGRGEWDVTCNEGLSNSGSAQRPPISRFC